MHGDSFANGDSLQQDGLDGRCRDQAWDVTGLTLARFPDQRPKRGDA